MPEQRPQVTYTEDVVTFERTTPETRERTDRQTDRQGHGTLVAILRSSSCSCSLAVLDPRVGHTMNVLTPFIPVLCHSD